MKRTIITIMMAGLIFACSDNEVSITTEVQFMEPPSLLQVVNAGAESITLSWVDNSTSETAFVIQMRTGSTDWNEAGRTGANTETYTQNELDDGIEYFFKVKAVNPQLESVYTDSVSATTLKKLQPFSSKYMQASSDTMDMFLNNNLRAMSVVNKYYENGQFVIHEYTSFPSASFEEDLTTYMDAETYHIIRFEEDLVQGSSRRIVNAVWDSLTVEITRNSNTFSRTLEPGTVERTAFFYSLNALPLAEGYTHSLKVFYVSGNEVWNVDLNVQGIEEVTVPAGTFQAYKILLTVRPTLHLYVHVETRKLVKMELPTMGWEYRLRN